MKLEQNDASLIFSTTNLPDVFFTEYLSQLTGDSIKIYLYMSFLAKFNKEIKLNDLSKKLNIPLETIKNSLKQLEDESLIIKKNTGYILNNIQEVELHKLYNPKITSSPEEIEKISQNKYRSKAIETINNEFFQGIMSASWYTDIDLWFKKYSFDEEVMVALFRYCFNRSKLHRNYIQAVAEAWFQNNIKTFNDLDKLNVIQKSISKKLGLTRNLTQFEEGYISTWYVDYGYNMDVIDIALKKTTSKANPNFEYLNTVISNWHERGLKTSNDVQGFLLQLKEKNKNIKTLEKNTGYTNYDQRNCDDLNRFYTN